MTASDRPPISVELEDSRAFYGFFFLFYVIVAALLISAPPLAIASGAAGLWSLLRFFTPRVRLRTTAEGIIDNTLPWYSPGLIPWDEIADIRAGAWRSDRNRVEGLRALSVEKLVASAEGGSARAFYVVRSVIDGVKASSSKQHRSPFRGAEIGR